MIGQADEDGVLSVGEDDVVGAGLIYENGVAIGAIQEGDLLPLHFFGVHDELMCLLEPRIKTDVNRFELFIHRDGRTVVNVTEY